MCNQLQKPTHTPHKYKTSYKNASSTNRFVTLIQAQDIYY